MCQQLCNDIMRAHFQALLAHGLQLTNVVQPFGRLLNNGRLGGYVKTIANHCDYDVTNMLHRDGLQTLDALEGSIRDSIEGYNVNNHDNDLLKEIFIKIQMWSGRPGTYIFTKGDGFVWNTVSPCYQTFVEECIHADQNLEAIRTAGEQFADSVPQIGIALSAIHIHFWTHATMRDNALPVFDNITSSRMGIPLDWNHAVCFWQGMRQILQDYHLTNMNALERQIALLSPTFNQHNV